MPRVPRSREQGGAVAVPAGGHTRASARVMFHAVRVTPDGCWTQL